MKEKGEDDHGHEGDEVAVIKGYGILKNMKEHKDEEHNIMPLCCSICECSTSKKIKFKLHEDHIHNNIEFQCVKCEDSAVRKS